MDINEQTSHNVIAYYMDRNLALREVQLTFNEVDRLFFSRFES